MVDYKKLHNNWESCRLAREQGKFLSDLNGINRFNAGHDFAYSKISDDGCSIEIVFDGTDSLGEWISDADCDRTGDLYDSEGFDDASEIFYDAMKFMCDLKIPFVLMGHSRGGPIAVGVAERFKRKHGSDVSVVSFGSPKQGGFKFVQAMRNLKIPHTRVEMDRDVVCDLPLNFTQEWEHYESEHILLLHKLHGVKTIHLGYGEVLRDYVRNNGSVRD